MNVFDERDRCLFVHLLIAFLYSPASSGYQEAETEIPVVQSLRLEEDEEKRSEEEQQEDEKEDGEAPPPPTAPSSSPPQPDQSQSTDAAEVKPEPSRNLIELETAEEKNSKTLEVT